MTLSDREIWMELQSGDLVIDPLSQTAVGPSSVDLHLDGVIYRFKTAPSGISVRLRDVSAADIINFATDRLDASEQPVDLAPDDFVIAFTRETVRIPNHLSGRVEGRSSYARLGLSVHNTAPMIQPGWGGQIALEISSTAGYTLQLDAGIPICQLILERLGRPAGTPYTGQFSDQSAG